LVTATEVTRLVARRERVPPLIDEAAAQSADEQRQAILQCLLAWNGEPDGVDPLVAELTTYLKALDELVDATYGRRQPSSPPSTKGVTDGTSRVNTTRSPSRLERPSTSVSFADDLLSARTTAGTAHITVGNATTSDVNDDSDSNDDSDGGDDGHASVATGARPHSVAHTSERWSRPSTMASAAARSGRPMSVAATVGGWSMHGAASPARSESTMSVDIQRLVPRVVVEPTAEPANPANETEAANCDHVQSTMQVAAPVDANPSGGPLVTLEMVDVSVAEEMSDQPPSTAMRDLLLPRSRPTPAVPTADPGGWLVGAASQPMLDAPSLDALLHNDGGDPAGRANDDRESSSKVPAPKDVPTPIIVMVTTSGTATAPPARPEPLLELTAVPPPAPLPETAGEAPVEIHVVTSELLADSAIPNNITASASANDPAPTPGESLADRPALTGPISAALDGPTPVDLAELLGDHM